jgi:hypothetical protein
MTHDLSAEERDAIRCLLACGACAFCALSTVNARAGPFTARTLTLAEVNAQLGVAAERRGDVCVICFGLLQRDEAFWVALVGGAAAVYRGLPPVEMWRIGIAVPVGSLIRSHWAVHVARAQCPQVRLAPCDIKSVAKQRMLKGLLAAQTSGIDVPRSELPDVPLECRIRVDHAEGVALTRAVADALGAAMPRVHRHGGKRHRGSSHDKRNEFFDSDEPSVHQVAPLLAQLGARLLDALPRQPTPPAAPANVLVDFVHDSIWVGGRYNKWARGISQSPWTVDESQPVLSVEDCFMPPLHRLFGTVTHALRTAGREDRDVRMLGSGRPFMVELIHPTTLNVSAQDIAALVAEINAKYAGQVSVRDVTILERGATALFHGDDDERRKAYRALVQTSEPPSAERLARLATMSDLAVQQRTPVRVAHRRANLTRAKTVHSMRMRALHERWYELELVSSSGMYIKEWVHGDFGRTTPSLASLLGVEWADIAQLDVTDVFMAFPRPEDCRLPVLAAPSRPPADLPLFTVPNANEDDDVGECD